MAQARISLAARAAHEPEAALLGVSDLATARSRSTGRISPWSRWSDARWYFVDPARPGHQYAAAVWDFELDDGSSFLEARFDDLRESAKLVIYSLHRFPAMRAPLKAQTVNEISIGIRYLIRWLVASGLEGLHQLDATALAAFEDYLVEDKLNEDLDETLTASSIARYMRAPFVFWEERQRLEAAGLSCMPEVPYPGETHHTVANRLARVAIGRIKPVPKDVLVPLMNAAERFIEGPALDVIAMARFLSEEVPAVFDETTDRGTRAQLGRYLTRKIKFSDFDGKPWHGPLTDEHERVGSKTLDVKTESSIELARDLVQDVMGAASILIQGAAGLRVSEIEMLEAEKIDPATGLPDCIEVRTDDTGTIELFYLRGFLVKTTKSRMPAEWLVGARVVGASHVPPPVLAVQRVYEVSRIVDARAKSGRLFVGSTGGAWGYFAGEATPLSGPQLQGRQRAFAANYVDRGLLDRREILRTHGWRKSFAQFVFGVDATLGPALSQHFKHLHIAMTMEAYVTNDASLLGYLDSERAMETARDLYEITTGRQAAAGRFSRQMVEHRQQFADLIAGKDEQAAVAVLHAHVLAHQVPFWFLEWGNCGVAFAPNEAACHDEAGTTSWRNTAPNFGYRDLDVCAGCSRLLILRRHLPFWTERYRRLKTAWDDLDESTGAVFRSALRKKLAQAKAVVRALGEPPASLRAT